MNYVFLDLETTGTKAEFERVLEIGALRVEDGKEVARMDTLVNPRVSVPYFIEKMTGIRSEELNDAPIFEEVCSELDKLLDGAVMVAHNANFDYSFLEHEYKRLGIDFSQRTLCSVKLSRRLFPQHRTHGLDAIMKRYDIGCERRHRAFDDAEVIYKFFQKIGYFNQLEMQNL